MHKFSIFLAAAAVLGLVALLPQPAKAQYYGWGGPGVGIYIGPGYRYYGYPHYRYGYRRSYRPYAYYPRYRYRPYYGYRYSRPYW